MLKKRIRKGYAGFSVPTFGNPGGGYSSFSGSQGSISPPDFNFSLTLKSSFNSGFDNLFLVPKIGETKPQTLAEWALNSLQLRWLNQQNDFHNSLDAIVHPQEPGFDPTKYGMTDYAQLFRDNTAPMLRLTQLQAGLALSSSSDPGTQLLGLMLVRDAMSEKLAQSFVAEKLGPSFKDLFSNSTFGKNYGTWSAGLGLADAAITGIFGEKNEYSGPKGDITRGLDAGYDTIQLAASQFGPIGKMVSLGMQANKMLGNVANKLGAGTDGMTTTDAILGSSFMQLTPFGLINGLTGKKADTLARDDAAFEAVGSSYGGTAGAVDEALKKSGKKYGGFSSGSRILANREIAEAKRQQMLMSEIADDATERFDIRNSMSAINGNRRALAMLGGYDLSAVRIGRHGISFKYLSGGKTKDPFDTYLQSLPEAQKDSTDFRVRDYWEFNGKPKNFDEAVAKGMFTLLEDGWHANSVAENPTTGEIEFMKSSSHPNHHMEVDWYNSDDAAEFRSQYELQKTEPYWKYVKKKPQGDAVGSYLEGGVLEISLSDVPEEYLEPLGTIEEVTLESILPEFKEGGKVNVIPEGALHARLHHMENAENLTKKGIPVVSEKEGGEVEQQAEIEREEIIFRLEVTKKLEELSKKYSDEGSSLKEKDEVAIEAGKLLVEEILNNTIDNTNNLL